jgi:hypothetical protein
MKRLRKDYGLGIAYVLLFLVTLGLHALFVWLCSLYATEDAVPWLLLWQRGLWENIQSENYQIGLFIILSAYLVYKGSPQSKDGSERQERKLDDLTRKVDWLLREAEARAQRESEREA